MILNRIRSTVAAAIVLAALVLAAFGAAPAEAGGGWIDPNGAARESGDGGGWIDPNGAA